MVEILPFASSLFGAILGALFTWVLANRLMPKSYRIAILGFPQTGKTTLITSLFEYIFRKGVGNLKIIPRGEETIKRVNDNISRLEKGISIKPTEDQDVFAYRAEVKSNGVLKNRYKLEIGDFPGEDTEAFTKNHGEWLHETQYFKWATSADAFLFVIDVGQVVVDKNGAYIPNQKRALRAAWQRLEENHLEGASDLSSKPVLLVFTKTDILLADDIENAVKEPTKYGNKIDSEYSVKEIEEKSNVIREEFGDLISYLERESNMFDLVFTSAFIRRKGERFGIPEMVNFVIPTKSISLRRFITQSFFK